MPSGSTQAAAEARRAEALGARLPPLLIAAERVAATVAQGVHGRRRVGQGDSFWQFRHFVQGDAVARIDWRQSAKSGRVGAGGWFIRETEWEAAQTVSLWRDGSAYKVEDLGSSNGTVLLSGNGETVRLHPHLPYPIGSGDRIRVGDTTLHFLTS